MGKIGREYLLTVKGCLPADDEDDPKYADFGRKLIQSGKGVFTEHGLLFVDENTPFQRLYDGQNFPAYVYDQMLCFIRAEYNGKTEFLYLPCEEEAIDKAFARLGAPTPDDVELSWEDICIDSDKWIGRFKEIAAEEGVYEVNRLANAVNSADMDLEKLWAVAEYGKAEDAKQLARLAENLDCFTFIIGASNYEEVGIYVTENTPELTRDMLAVDRDMEVDCDIGHQITCYLETWFDVDKKFGTNTAADDDKWLNLYAKYDPFADTLRFEFTVTTADSCEEGEYVPTDAEAQLIKGMIAEKLREEYGQTPKEFCEDVGGIEIGGMTQ